jgi:hypothetical protein
MTNQNDSGAIQTQLTQIQQKQDALLLLTKQHLEMYSTQLNQTNQMNSQLVELQKRSYQSQMIVMTIAAMLAFGAVMFIVFS